MTMKIELRSNQVDTLDKVRAKFLSGASSVCLVSPTGSGKTIMFNAVVDGAVRRGNQCLILAHRIELVDQTSASLVDLGVPRRVIAPGYPETPEPVQVASVQSLVRRLDRHDNYDLVVVDEAFTIRSPEHGSAS